MSEYKVFSMADLLAIFPFSRTKMFALIHTGSLPVVRVGRSYLTTKPLSISGFRKLRSYYRPVSFSLQLWCSCDIILSLAAP